MHSLLGSIDHFPIVVYLKSRITTWVDWYLVVLFDTVMVASQEKKNGNKATGLLFVNRLRT